MKKYFSEYLLPIFKLVYKGCQKARNITYGFIIKKISLRLQCETSLGKILGFLGNRHNCADSLDFTALKLVFQNSVHSFLWRARR